MNSYIHHPLYRRIGRLYGAGNGLACRRGTPAGKKRLSRPPAKNVNKSLPPAS